MADDFKVQINAKFADQLFNFRGETVEEVAGQLATFAEHADAIFDNFDTVRQVLLAKGMVAANGFVPAPSGPAQTQHASAAAGSTPAELRCVHGPYKDLLGKKDKNGNVYRYRYYCAGPFGKNCKPADLPGQESQS